MGTSVSTIVTLTNNGFTSIAIDNIEINSSGDYNATSSIGLPVQLLYGQYLDIVVVFTPSAEGTTSADLIIMNGQIFTVPLSGTGVSQPPPLDVPDFRKRS